MGIYEKIILLLSMLLIFSGCEKQKFISSEEEMILSVDEVPTSWNEGHRLKIETDKGVYFINQIASFRKEKVLVKKYEKNIQICTKQKCYTVIQ